MENFRIDCKRLRSAPIRMKLVYNRNRWAKSFGRRRRLRHRRRFVYSIAASTRGSAGPAGNFPEVIMTSSAAEAPLSAYRRAKPCVPKEISRRRKPPPATFTSITQYHDPRACALLPLVHLPPSLFGAKNLNKRRFNFKRCASLVSLYFIFTLLSTRSFRPSLRRI